ncbi:hypothetical protein LCGC14_3111510 [marine sediment metagenome]|uniref:Uncharacterized protein n=1 Tax=marine sediment metagenome TaxID=412755 RepID=A0A0F8W4Y0_9ZZZZ
MKKPKLEVSATRKNDDWVTVDEMKQEERLVNDDKRKFHFYCKICDDRTEHIKSGDSYECIECVLINKPSET